MPKKLYTATFRFEGKRYYVRSSVSQRDADKRAAKKLAELEDAREILSPETRVEDYALQWLEAYKKDYVSEPVYKATKSRIVHIIAPQIGHMRIKDVRPTHLQKVLSSVPGKSRNYYVKLRELMKGIFTRAQGDHLIRDNPALNLDLPTSKDGTHRSITMQERAELLYKCTWHSFGPFVLTMLWCGLRPQEVMALRYEDIDQINHTLHVQRAVKNDGMIGPPKSEAGDRIIPIPPQLWERLRLREGWLFRDIKGRQLNRMAVAHAWKVMGCDFDLYDLRHTYCTDLQAAGVPIDVARYLMGHSSISITSKIYTHMREDTMANAAAQIAAFGATVGATTKYIQSTTIDHNKDEKNKGRAKFKRA